MVDAGVAIAPGGSMRLAHIDEPWSLMRGEISQGRVATEVADRRGTPG
jgi:hypothetical protein